MSKLAEFRLPGDVEPESVPMPELTPGRVLAFDQSIASTGWAVVSYTEVSGLTVHKAGLLKTDVSADGWEGTYRRSLEILEQMSGVVHPYVDPANPGGSVQVIAHEYPVSKGGKRAESSVLAGMAVRIVALATNMPVMMIARQRVTTTFCGHSKATKTQFKAAIESTPWLHGKELLTNEHTRDAAGIATLALTPKEIAKYAHQG